ncbi:unnamed protein product [Ectocarpus sp. CCAP 1310/34]|nr:unnamed protein product [Ectocarpus sp. CCAP 1310/34]
MYDRRRANRQLKIRLLQAEVVETLLYGCASWSLTAEHYTKLNGTHRQFLTRCIGWSKRKRSDRPPVLFPGPHPGRLRGNHRGHRAQTETVFRGLCYAHGGQPPPQAHAVRSDGEGRGIPGRAGERLGVSSWRGPRGLQHGRRKGRG